MNFTLDTLNALVNRQDFCALPTQLAQDISEDNWIANLSVLAEEGARHRVWEAAQYAALLFDTYGEHIDAVVCHFCSIGAASPDMMQNLYINAKSCKDNYIDLPADLMAKLEQIDEAYVLKTVVGRLTGLADNNLLGQLHILEDGGRSFTSSEQAKEIARRVAPKTEAWVRQMTLAETVVTGPTRARAPHKM